MKKLIFLFFLVANYMFGQVSTGQEQEFDYGIKNNSTQTVTSPTYIVTQGVDGTYGKIFTSNLVTPTTTAGTFSRVFFTGDVSVVNSVNYYATSLGSKGTALSVAQSVTNNDDQKQYFTQDWISILQPSLTIYPSGSYTGQLTVQLSDNAAQQRFTIEIYKTNDLGTPIASGVTGAPVGALGVTVVAILDSGLLNLQQNVLTNISLTGQLNSALTVNANERIRYHISAAKVGIAGGNNTMTVFVGQNYNSYYDVPVPTTTDGVVNKSTVVGASSTEALNTLNTGKINNSEKGVASGVATLDSNGKLVNSQIPDLAITSVILATQTTIAAFAAASGSYTFDQGDVIILDNGNGDFYMYNGGTKTVVSSYNSVEATEIDWSQITNRPTTVAGYGITDAVTGSGTVNSIPKITTAPRTLGNSSITDDGTTVQVNSFLNATKTAAISGTNVLGHTYNITRGATTDLFINRFTTNYNEDGVAEGQNNSTYDFRATRNKTTNGAAALVVLSGVASQEGTGSFNSITGVSSSLGGVGTGAVISATLFRGLSSSTPLNFPATNFFGLDLRSMPSSNISNTYGVRIGDVSGTSFATALQTEVSSGANKWNLYINGTASNYINGTTLFGTTTNNGVDKVQIAGSTTQTGQFKSTLATGTAPLNVASTTVNTNLNADLLDGLHASAFQTVLTNPITGTGTNNTMVKFTGTNTVGNSQIIDNGTNVGIGVSPTEKLSVAGNMFLTGDIKGDGSATLRTIWGGAYGGVVQLKTDGATSDRYARIGMIAGDGVWQGGLTIENGAAAVFASNVTATAYFTTSDIRLKKVLRKKYNSFEIKPIVYKWRDKRDEKVHVGYSAQQVEKYMPDAVNTDKDGFKSVDYIQVLVNKIAELEARIIELEKK